MRLGQTKESNQRLNPACTKEQFIEGGTLQRELEIPSAKIT